MRHYLLTRFNLRLWPHNKVGEETQTEEWLRDWCVDVERVFITGWIPRAVRVFGVHVKHKLFGHDWWK